MDPRDLFEQAFLDIHPDTETEYPCTQSDLNACGGKSRKAPNIGNPSLLRTLWFPHPNKDQSDSVEKASRDIFDHNQPERTGEVLPAGEHEAIGHLLAMFDNACHGSWGPDLAIKSFCDLDTVFFRGKLRGHVCVTWAARKEFGKNADHILAHTIRLGKGKALIQVHAHIMFLDQGLTGGRLFASMFATMLHEMV